MKFRTFSTICLIVCLAISLHAQTPAAPATPPASEGTSDNPIWPAIMTGEFARMIKVFASPEMKDRQMPNGYPLGDRIWNKTGLYTKTVRYFHDMQAGSATQEDANAIAKEIRETVRREVVAYIDYSFVLQMQHHNYPSVRAYVAERYTPGQPDSMWIKMVNAAATACKWVVEMPGNAARWFADIYNGILKWMCEGAMGLSYIMRFFEMCLDITLEISVFLVVAMAPLVMVEKLRTAVVGHVNNILTLCLTSGTMILLFCLWEGVVVAIGAWIFGYDPHSITSNAKMVGGAALLVINPFLAGEMAFWAGVGMEVTKIVGYVLMAFQSRKVACAILKGEAFVGGLIKSGMTAIGAGTLAAGAGMFATMASAGAATTAKGWGPMLKSIGSGGPFRPPGGPGGAGVPSPMSASSPSAVGSGVGSGGGPNVSPSAPSGGGGAGRKMTAEAPESSPLLAPRNAGPSGPTVGPVSGLVNNSPKSSLISKVRSAAFNSVDRVQSVANHDWTKKMADRAMIPLREISHAVNSGGDPSKYYKNRTAAKRAAAQSEATAETSTRDPGAERVRSAVSPLAMNDGSAPSADMPSGKSNARPFETDERNEEEHASIMDETQAPDLLGAKSGPVSPRARRGPPAKSATV